MKTLIKMQFDPRIAKDIGVEEAIMYSNIEFWCAKNEANNKNKHDGHYWTYNTEEAFIKLFPFWTRRQIQRIIKKLIINEYLLVGRYNKHKYDRTKWYSCIEPNGSKLRTKRFKATNQTVQPIPYNKHILKNTNKKHLANLKNSPTNLVNQIFDIFYKTNPTLNWGNKTQRKAAEFLIEKLGFEKTVKTARAAVACQGEDYAPVITTPCHLKEKLAQLVLFYKRNNNKEKKGIRIY